MEQKIKKNKVKRWKKIAVLMLTSFIITIPAASTVPQIENIYAAQSIVLNQSRVTLIKGQSTTLKLMNTTKKTTFRSSNTKIAKVSSSGKVTALAKGSAVITATSDGKKYTCNVTVESPYLNKTSVSIPLGSTMKIAVKATKQTYSFGTEDSSIAVISKGGTITPKAEGKTRVYAKIGTTKIYCNVTVLNKSLREDKLKAYIKKNDIENGDKITEEVIKIAHEIITEEMSKVEKIKAVHDYIINHTKYATKELQSWNQRYSSIMDLNSYQKLVQQYGWIYSPEGVLFKQKAVCQGYAETFQLFMELLGIDSMIITGIGEGVSHAWNLVKLEDGWYHIDTTFDDPITNYGDVLSYDYFLLNDDLIKVNHSWEEEYPAANGKEYLLYGYQDALVANTEEAIQKVKDYAKNNSKGEEISLLIPVKDADVDAVIKEAVNTFYTISYSTQTIGNSYISLIIYV